MAFRPLMQAMPSHVDTCLIELPGRGTRVTEPLVTDMSVLVEDLVEGILPLCDVPFALYGHSMGAAIAIRIARRLRERHRLQPCRIVVSGARAPHLKRPAERMHVLGDEALIGRLRTMGGTLPALFANAELRDMMLGIVRADFQLLEEAGLVGVDPFECPIDAYGGSADPFVEPESVEGWRFHTMGPFRCRILPGGHFFQREHVGTMAGEMGAALRQAGVTRSGPAGGIRIGRAMMPGGMAHG